MGLHNYAVGFIGLSFLYCMIIGIKVTTGQECSNTGNFTTNSTYGRNRNITLSSLISNVVRNGGFYNTTTGEDPNKVYGLALCRGDTSSDVCFKCVNSTSQALIDKCPNQKEALSWGATNGLCIVRYSNRSFLGTTERSPILQLYNTGNITSNMAEFNQIWGSLMATLLTKASRGSSRRKFGADEADLTPFQKIYALMQCTPDLSQMECESCLRQSVNAYQSCCYGKQGGLIYTPSCNFRWELYPFFTNVPNAPAPVPVSDTGVPPPDETKNKGGTGSATIIIIVVSIVISMVLLAVVVIVLRKRNSRQQIGSEEEKKDDDEIDNDQSLQFNFNTIGAATNNFSIDNKLGEGGFGIVYKGRLPNGRDIAVKRLSTTSRQGHTEFKNEVLLVAKLQHRNLVRLLGFSFQGNERLLVYEFVPHSSLDNFLFDPIKRLLLNWEIRYKIVEGIARGLIYLHEDSRLRIIHRDLKAGNILLDADMSPKITDFGMARLFDMDQTQGNTKRIVGTYGYMAPEYLIHGHISVKSDIFSFGVLVLEIISGRKNNTAEDEAGHLLTHAWENWRSGTALNLVDPALTIGSRSEMMRCIHIGLLCVQKKAADRPTMASIALMLTSSSSSLPVPSKPAFFLHNSSEFSASCQSKSGSVQYTINDSSITELEPR